MATHPYLNALEFMQVAIHRVNKRSPVGLQYKSVRILVALYGCDTRGEVLTQNGLLLRLIAGRNMDSRHATWQAIDTLVRKGYILKNKVGRVGYVSCSLAGRNYVVMLETTLKRLRWGSIG